MNCLLSVFVNTILPISIIIILLVISIFIFKWLQKKFNRPIKTALQRNNTPEVKLKERFCTEREMKFLEALHKALPREFIAFPYVGVDNIVNPKNDKNAYNKIMAKYIDVCIFYRRTMQPVLAIDLFNSNPIKQALKKMDKDVYDALKMINLPIIEIKLVEHYDLNILKKNIYDSLPPKIFALIKDNK